MWLEIRENTVQEVWRIFGSFKEDLLGHVRLFLQFFMKNSYFPLNNRHPKAGLMTRPFFRFNIFSTDITIYSLTRFFSNKNLSYLNPNLIQKLKL